MFDLLNEILETMRKNKMRTFLTGLAVAWGMFMLIVLLGAGNGLQNGIRSGMEGWATNWGGIWPGWTSKPYKGLKTNRRIRFDERTVEFVRNNFPEVEYLTGYIYRNTTSVSYGEEYGAWRIQGQRPDAFHINYVELLKGRLLNNVDEEHRRKVGVIGKATAEMLFKNGEDPLGKYIIADDVAIQVVGVYDTPWQPNNNPPIFIPLSTAKALYDRGWAISDIEFTVKGINTIKESEAFEERVRQKMGSYLGFDPTDTSAIWISNGAEWAIRENTIFVIMNIFLWIIGFASLLSGIIGVANIMLVTVRERTREIGIRKAIGATPWSIIKSVIIEAVFITAAAGYIGILMGIGLTELLAKVLSGGGGNAPAPFKDPTVGLGVVFAALGVLIVCGVVAGLIPSLKATKIRPIEAMRAD